MLQSIAGGGATSSGATDGGGRTDSANATAGAIEGASRNGSAGEAAATADATAGGAPPPPGGGGQFICTTFRPEMLLVAEKCYGVRYERKSSSVVVVSREESLSFVEGERQ